MLSHHCAHAPSLAKQYVCDIHYVMDLPSMTRLVSKRAQHENLEQGKNWIVLKTYRQLIARKAEQAVPFVNQDVFVYDSDLYSTLILFCTIQVALGIGVRLKGLALLVSLCHDGDQERSIELVLRTSQRGGDLIPNDSGSQQPDCSSLEMPL
ncbi:hypothetical protein FGB62_79g00 [Gracilaria domingensis]|nr:hypothetical protein FGB62_79g00 [Gracilaria domingensis]